MKPAKEKNPNNVRAGRKSKRKGSTNERALAHAFRAWWGHGEWVRTPSSGGWATPQHRESFRACGDIMTTAQDFPFCIEAKKQEKWFLEQLIHNESCKIVDWLAQAEGETPPGLLPLLVMSRNHVPQAVMFAAAAVERLQRQHAWEAPCAVWQNYKFFTYTADLLSPTYVIMTLEDFFKINPATFGRKIPSVGTGPEETKAE